MLNLALRSTLLLATTVITSSVGIAQIPVSRVPISGVPVTSSPIPSVPVATDPVAKKPAATEASVPKTFIRIYPVGNLISANTMNPELSSVTTTKQWGAQYPQTMNGLDDLEDIVKTMCSDGPMTIKKFPPSLSLVVRHSAEGHEEVAALLKSLAEERGELIEMNCRMLYADTPPKSSNPDHTEADRERLMTLLHKKYLSSAETTELRELMPEQDSKYLDSLYNHDVSLYAGSRTPWHVFGQSYTALGRIGKDGKQIELRIDYIADGFDGETFPCGSQVFSIAEGHSAIFNTQFDGSVLAWLVTAKVANQDAEKVSDETKAESVPHIATKNKE